MENSTMKLFGLVIFFIFTNIVVVHLQVVEDVNDRLIWCTVSEYEFVKCEQFARAANQSKAQYGSSYLKLMCKQASSKDECMSYLDEEVADIISLDAGEVFIGGRYHSLVPIMQEEYEGGMKFFYAVAVIKRNTLQDVNSLYDLRGKMACFGDVGTQAGWVIPIYKLMKRGGMEIFDCNNHVKSAIKYFGPSCAVNSLIDKYNPVGDNSDQLCKLCKGRYPGEWCNTKDPYSNYEGAFRCLVDDHHQGDKIAFMKHTTVSEMTGRLDDLVGVSKSNFELLCPDGSRRSVDEYSHCNWGQVPTHAIVTSSAKTIEVRKMFQKFLKQSVKLFGGKSFINNTSYYDRERENNPPGGFQGNSLYSDDEYVQNETFHLFQSPPRFQKQHNLLVQDVAVNFVPIEETQQTYAGYLGRSLDLILGVRECPVNRMTLCVTSEPELEKCVKMRTALKAQLLKPEMSCYKGHSHINCMQAIRNGNADIAVLDAGDVYTGGLRFDLVPFISEVYNLGEAEYYVVAVAKEEDPNTEITYLKGKYTCHGGINTGAGWIVPMAYLISNGWVRSYGCNSIRAAAEYFTKSCVPGAMSSEYNTGMPYENMCHLCHGASFRQCRRDASEEYYGHTGAFRCLVEGGGHVAFVKHTTVMENADGKRQEFWARNSLTSDFELLCPDGTRAEMYEYKRCNLGKVKANAIVTRGGEAYNETEINAFINLFIYAQQFYGRKDPDEFSFSMFYSPPPYSDLIFQDAAQQLKIIEPHKRNYWGYLGKDFLRARRIVDCQAGAISVEISVVSIILSTVLSLVLSNY